MHLIVRRLKRDGHETIGFLSIDGNGQYFTLEDTKRDIKVHGKTRISEGVYEIKLRNEGGMTKNYLAKYGADFHKGMLHLQDVPNFKYVYIHTGNNEEDTDGCILVGVTCDLSKNNKSVGRSVDAYKIIYPQIRDAILRGEKVTVAVVDD